MKRIVTLAFVAVVLSAVLIGTAYADPIPDKTGAFSVEVAAGWKVDAAGAVMDLVGPNDIPHVSVTKEAVSGITLDQFANAYVAQAKKELAQFDLITYGKTTVNGTEAGVWVYTAKVSGLVLQFRNFVMFKNGTMYNVVFATIPARYKTDVAGFDEMMKSWKWL
jgi:hypothetical protein